MRKWTAIFGPSASGKTTILRAIAGLLHKPTQARIELGGDVLTDTSARIHVPAHLRRIGLVGQQTDLFPHLSVIDNIRYGQRSRRCSRKRNTKAVATPPPDAASLLASFRAGHLSDRMPAQLSGGERQRVALARALAAEPHLLLLDEAFTGLDAALKQSLIDGLQEWLARTHGSILSVTHDVGEAFATAAEVITLEVGKVKAQGPPAIVLAAERAQLLAQLKAAPL